MLGVGLMSGTSADGVDAALVRVHGEREVELVEFVSLPYTGAERDKIRTAISDGDPGALAHLNFELGGWFAGAVEEVLRAAGIEAADLDFIASHGHTIWHAAGRVTLQFGEPAVLAERFGVRVVSDFRARDVAAAGQGAPLVSLADVRLFGGDGARVLLNIGGMANATWVPASGTESEVVAFDTGPGMSLIDVIVREQFPGEPYDIDGVHAANGRVNAEVVDNLLRDKYFPQPPPKSTGREHFGDRYARDLCSRVRERNREAVADDYIATAVEFTARSISDQMKFLPGVPRDMVVSGGGARNRTLVARLRELNAGIDVVQFGDLFFDGDAKEAVAFAYLGWLSLSGLPGNIPGVTGARGPRVIGKITPP